MKKPAKFKFGRTRQACRREMSFLVLRAMAEIEYRKQVVKNVPTADRTVEFLDKAFSQLYSKFFKLIPPKPLSVHIKAHRIAFEFCVLYMLRAA